MSDLTNPLWGTGYGSKRHLVDRTPAVHARTGMRLARARCGSAALRWFADAPTSSHWLGPKGSQAEYVTSLKPCARCTKIAAKEAQA